MSDKPMSEPSLTRQARKQVQGAPRVFISYRREDSIAVAGRLYDRLVSAFGETHVFKDVDSIPVGVNFKTILENEVHSCDILLAVIGEEWLDIRDKEGQRRLDNPDDFVRIEIAAGLNRNDILVVPVLVNNAGMPGADQLTPDLTDLTFRNAAMVRNDPDFHHDVNRLIEQIQDSFTIVPDTPAQRRFPWVRAAVVAAAALIVIVFGAWLISPALTPDPTSPPATTPTNAAASAPTAGKTDTTSSTSAQVAPGEYIVLVADFEPLGEQRDVSRFIVRDLARKLEQDVPFSQVRVQAYEQVIHSPEEAQAAAEATGATVVVWGNYTADLIEAEIQVGSEAAFSNIQFERDVLERTANVTVHISDARGESIVTPVLTVLAALQLADGNGFELIRTMAILDQLDAPALEVEGNGVSAHLHRSMQTLLRDPATAIEESSAAIALDPGNPLLYVERASARARAGELDAAGQDANSAARRAPADWALPAYVRGVIAQLQNDWDNAIVQYNKVIEQRPDDWFPYNMRGWFHYLKGEYDLAVADYEQALALKPNANFPYVVAGLIALRQGRMADARSYFDTILRDYPDPSFGNRFVQVLFGQKEDELVGPMFSAVGHFILEQYDQMLLDTRRALAVNDQSTDLYAMEGFAYCNLGQFAEAEAAYDQAIQIEPDSPFSYLLRADARLQQRNLLGANDDTNRVREIVQKSGTGTELLAYLDAGLRGQVNCKNFFEWQPPE